MFSLMIALVLMAMLAMGPQLSSAQTTGDVYVFAYSWEAEFCYGEYGTYPGCSTPDDYWLTHFTVHGLWPQYSSGGYPSFCTTEAFDPAAPEAVGMDTMIEYWPNVQEAVDGSDYDSFWEHEWTKHGTCTPMTQTAYFNATINLAKAFSTPTIVSQNVGGTVSASDLRTAMGGASKASLQCSGPYLSGVFTCWSMDSQGNPVAQVTCPSDVQGEDTCSSSTLTVQAFTPQ
jgi:ribonuclease T2